MPLREDLLEPIPGANPGGEDLRYDPVYDRIKEARRQEAELPQGVWTTERKVADWESVIKLCQDMIATRSKDLQLAAWLTEALLKQEAFAGLAQGLNLCRRLIENFWDHLYPMPEDGDLWVRAAPIDWLGQKLDTPVKAVPLCRGGFGLSPYKFSRTLSYEDAAKTKQQKSDRESALKEGKVLPEVFDKSFTDTPKSFYAEAENKLNACLEHLSALDAVCRAKFTDESPGFGNLRSALEEVQKVVHNFLEQKREREPDPAPEKPRPQVETESPEPPRLAPGGVPALVQPPVAVPVRVATEPAGRAEAIGNIVAAAAFLRKREPGNPAPYLMLRGLRWGELRVATDPMALEAPPTEIRQQIRTLAAMERWAELIEAAENVMGLPCSRAWLDLQRLVVDACVALGQEYYAVAVAIRSELRTLLRDLPSLLDATLNDDTPAANAQTQVWLRGLMAEPADAPPRPKLLNAPVLDGYRATGGWQKTFIDAYALAVDALRNGQAQNAIDLLREEMERQRSGRGRFQRKLQLAQICVAAGKDAIAQPLLDDLAAAIENHKLEDWEDRETVAAALTFLIQASKKIQSDAKLKASLFDRICRLDPVKAIEVA